MHGEPIQYVTLYCGKIGCPAKPAVKGGDRYSSGFESGERFKECEKEARNAAATEWNTRTPTPLEKSHRELYEACVRTVDAIEKYPERKHPMTASEIILKIALQNAEKIIK